MDVQPISVLKSTMPAVLRTLRENRRPIMVVSKGRPQAVLQDVASYESAQDAISDAENDAPVRAQRIGQARLQHEGGPRTAADTGSCSD